ncbi:uncharacterized, partial [Tachysurus ichikawai]
MWVQRVCVAVQGPQEETERTGWMENQVLQEHLVCRGFGGIKENQRQLETMENRVQRVKLGQQALLVLQAQWVSEELKGILEHMGQRGILGMMGNMVLLEQLELKGLQGWLGHKELMALKEILDLQAQWDEKALRVLPVYKESEASLGCQDHRDHQEMMDLVDLKVTLDMTVQWETEDYMEWKGQWGLGVNLDIMENQGPEDNGDEQVNMGPLVGLEFRVSKAHQGLREQKESL